MGEMTNGRVGGTGSNGSAGVETVGGTGSNGSAGVETAGECGRARLRPVSGGRVSGRRWLQAGLAALWVGLGLSSALLFWSSGVSFRDVPQAMSERLGAFGVLPAVGLALGLYTVRPLVLFPSTLMGVASGMAFGPVLGCGVTLVGELLGACLAFAVTRVLGRRWAGERMPAALARWDRRLSERGVLSVSVMRLTLLPFDSVSFACGLTGVRARDFLLGTLLGGGPYILGVTLLGGSAAAGLDGDFVLWGLSVSRRVLVLALSAGSFLVGIGLAWRWRRWYTGESVAAAGAEGR